MKEEMLEIDSDLIERLSDHIRGLGKVNDIDSSLAGDLLKAFPLFRYEGLAFRAVQKEWNNNHPNISWSLTEAGSVFAYQSNHNGARNCWMYQGEIVGFNIGAFVKSLPEDKYLTEERTSLYLEYEFEILSVSHDETSLELLY